MFSKSITKISTINELAQTDEFKKLVSYPQTIGQYSSTDEKVFRKTLLSAWVLENLNSHHSAIEKICVLEIAHVENHLLEQQAPDSTTCSVNKLIALCNNLKPSLSAQLVKKLQNEKKDEIGAPVAGLKVTKTGITTSSRLSELLVNLHNIIKSMPELSIKAPSVAFSLN